MIKNILRFVTIFALLFNASFSSAFANITTATTTRQVLNSDNQSLVIGDSENVTDGDLDVTGDIAVDATFGNIGLSISVYAGNGKGIKASGDNEAIVAYTGLLQNLLVSSGRVTSEIGLAADPADNSRTVTLLDSNSNIIGDEEPVAITTDQNGSIDNTSGTGGIAIFYKNSVGNTSLVINNVGSIRTSNNANSTGIHFEDASGSILAINNNSTGLIGYVETDISGSGLGKAVGVVGNNSATITNNGLIRGSISGDSGQLTITNSGSSSARIFGNIDLGSNAASSLSISAGSVSGDLTFRSSSQRMTITGGSFSGGIIGAGAVGVEGGTLKLNSTNATTSNADFTAAINGYYASDDNDGSPVGSMEINASQDVTAGNHIGATQSINSILLKENSTLRLNEGTSRSINAATLGMDRPLGTITLETGAKLYIGTAAVNAKIESIADSTGDIYFTDSNTLRGNISSSSSSVQSVNLSSGVGILTNSKTISADTINLGTNSYLQGTMTLLGNTVLNTVLGDGAEIILDSGSSVGATTSSSVNGTSDGYGYFTVDTGTSTINANIGQAHRINDFTVSNGAIGNIYGSIAANTITVEGEMKLLDPTVNALAGNLTTSSGGNLNLGSADSTLSGAATFNSGAILSVALGNAGVNGSLTATGEISLSANTTLNLTIASGTTVGSSYTILVGGAGSSLSTINASNFKINGTTTNRFESYLASSAIVGNTLVINFTSSSASSSPLSTTSITRNSTQLGVYNNINSISSPSGTLSILKDYLDSGSRNDDQKSAALDSATPQTDNSSNRLTFNNISASAGLISNRIETVRNNVSSSGKSSGDESLNKSFWIEGFGSNAKQGRTTQSESYAAKSTGFILGLDKKLDQELMLGIAYAYSNSDIKSKGNVKRTGINSHQVSIYSGFNSKNYFLNALIGTGFNDFSSRRNIEAANTSARAEYSGQSYFARLQSGKNFSFKSGFVLTPDISITAARNSIDNYSEEGAGTLNLTVKTKSTDFFEGRAGLKLGKTYSSSKDKKISPFISASYGYDFAGAKQRTVSNFSGQSTSFTSTGENIARGSSIFGTGLKIDFSDSFGLKAVYNLEHRDQFRAHNASLNAKYKF